MTRLQKRRLVFTLQTFFFTAGCMLVLFKVSGLIVPIEFHEGPVWVSSIGLALISSIVTYWQEGKKDTSITMRLEKADEVDPPENY